jgi:hypothetical protein
MIKALYKEIQVYQDSHCTSFEQEIVILSLHSYLKQTKLSFSSFTKLENRRAEQVLSVRVDTSGRGRMWGEGTGG